MIGGRMDEPDGDGGRGIANGWKAAHQALHEDAMALVRIVADKERVAAKLDVLESHADRLGTQEERVRLVKAEREEFAREGAAVVRLMDEIERARENCLAEHVAGREDAERRAREAERALTPETGGDEKQAVAERLEAEIRPLKEAFDQKHTTVFLRLHDQVRAWLERYDPSGALRQAIGGRRGV